jgi:hypothetical protein
MHMGTATPVVAELVHAVKFCTIDCVMDSETEARLKMWSCCRNGQPVSQTTEPVEKRLPASSGC